MFTFCVSQSLYERVGVISLYRAILYCSVASERACSFYGEIEDSQVLDGLMLNKDITHPKMRRRIENPKVMLLDCPLEYKKGESQTNIEISKEEDWNRILQIEEEQIKTMCDAIIALKPDLVITEKGVSGTLLRMIVFSEPS